jgi:hypothetical protein
MASAAAAERSSGMQPVNHRCAGELARVGAVGFAAPERPARWPGGRRSGPGFVPGRLRGGRQSLHTRRRQPGGRTGTPRPGPAPWPLGVITTSSGGTGSGHLTMGYPAITADLARRIPAPLSPYVTRAGVPPYALSVLGDAGIELVLALNTLELLLAAIGLWVQEARLPRVVTVRGCSGPSTRSRMGSRAASWSRAPAASPASPVQRARLDRGVRQSPFATFIDYRVQRPA